MRRKSTYEDLAVLVWNNRSVQVGKYYRSKRSRRSNRSRPLLHPPPRRGGGQRWGFEPFDCGQDKLHAVIELLELFGL